MPDHDTQRRGRIRIGTSATTSRDLNSADWSSWAGHLRGDGHAGPADGRSLLFSGQPSAGYRFGDVSITMITEARLLFLGT